MKKLFFIPLLMSSYLKAQPVITTSVIPTIGQTISFSYITDTIHEWELTTGANQVWNFGSLNISGGAFTQVVATSSTPFGINYPGSNICFKSSYGTDTAYNYQNMQTPFVEVLGTTIASATTNVTYYTDAMRTFGFPFTFGDMYSDIFEYYGSGTNQSHRVGNLIVNAVGYGSLTTPAGTFPNSLLVKRNFVYIDSTFSVSTIVKHVFVTSYTFYQASDYALLTVLYDSTYVPASGASFLNYNATYKNITTDLDEIENNNFIAVFPNPSTGDLKIKFETLITEGKIELFNDLAAKVYDESILNESEKAINIKSVAPGIYFAKVFDGEKYYCKKLIIKH